MIIRKVSMALRVAFCHMLMQTRLPCSEDGYFSACVKNGCCMLIEDDICCNCDGCYARYEASQLRKQPFVSALLQMGLCSRDFFSLQQNKNR